MKKIKESAYINFTSNDYDMFVNQILMTSDLLDLKKIILLIKKEGSGDLYIKIIHFLAEYHENLEKDELFQEFLWSYSMFFDYYELKDIPYRIARKKTFSIGVFANVRFSERDIQSILKAFDLLENDDYINNIYSPFKKIFKYLNESNVYKLNSISKHEFNNVFPILAIFYLQSDDTLNNKISFFNKIKKEYIKLPPYKTSSLCSFFIKKIPSLIDKIYNMHYDLNDNYKIEKIFRCFYKTGDYSIKNMISNHIMKKKYASNNILKLISKIEKNRMFKRYKITSDKKFIAEIVDNFVININDLNVEKALGYYYKNFIKFDNYIEKHKTNFLQVGSIIHFISKKIINYFENDLSVSQKQLKILELHYDLMSKYFNRFDIFSNSNNNIIDPYNDLHKIKIILCKIYGAQEYLERDLRKTIFNLVKIGELNLNLLYDLLYNISWHISNNYIDNESCMEICENLSCFLIDKILYFNNIRHFDNIRLYNILIYYFANTKNSNNIVYLYTTHNILLNNKIFFNESKDKERRSKIDFFFMQNKTLTKTLLNILIEDFPMMQYHENFERII